MGCVSSNLLNNEEELTQLGSSALSHHIVSLTSTTYGLLNLDPPPSSPPPPQSNPLTTPPTPPARFTLGSIFPSPPLSETNTKTNKSLLWSEPRPLRSDHLHTPPPQEIINSWELMSGLDTDSFRFSPIFKKLQTPTPLVPTPPSPLLLPPNKENSNPNFPASAAVNPLKGPSFPNNVVTTGSDDACKPSNDRARSLDMFQSLCPPNGEHRVVIYTTTLRGIRKTFEACNVVRAAIEGLGVAICERDVSMDRGFREELSDLMKGKDREEMVPPRVFVKGRYVGGAEEVMRIVDEGWMAELLDGLPKKKAGDICEGCGDSRFLPCFSCNGSSKMVMAVKHDGDDDDDDADVVVQRQDRIVVVRCPDCNENGLVLCPICS